MNDDTASPRPPPPRRRLAAATGLCIASILCAKLLLPPLQLEEVETQPTRDVHRGGGSRRRALSYLDPKPHRMQPYGRAIINQNYQALRQPSEIDSDLFRKRGQSAGVAGGGNDGTYNKGYADDESACDDVLLFMPYSFAHNGHGSQLNNYILAAMIATFTNRAMVILEIPPGMNEFKSNSQFGCPAEAWETKMVRTGAPPKRIGWNRDFPTGLSRLVKHPAWLSRQCPVPCQKSHGYERWDRLRMENNATLVPQPKQVKCKSGNGRKSNVIVMGGQQLRQYFDSYYKYEMLDRTVPDVLSESNLAKLRNNYEWALRFGAAPHEARIFGGLRDRREVWDYASAFMGRAGILRFQPWIARDVERYITTEVELPLDVPYDAMHIRRGDKLDHDSRHFVIKYWSEQGMYNPDTGEMPREYIPFAHYLRQFDEVSCNVDGRPRLVYVATDDPTEVKSEITELPRDDEGYYTIRSNGPCQHRFQFIFSPLDPSLGFHIDKSSHAKDDCDERYARNIASIADLMILAKSDTYVGEYNSNWGRLVRTFRVRMNEKANLASSASFVPQEAGNNNNPAALLSVQRPVVERDVKIAWGHQYPGPPGW